MSNKPKRRWFQFSLRTMLVAVALAGITSARVAYLRQMASFHQAEEQVLVARIEKLGGAPHAYLRGNNPELDAELDKYLHHKSLREQYERAACRPWTVVHETQSPSWDS